MRRWYATFVVLIVLAAGYAGYWVYVSGVVERGIERWIADQRRQGGIVESAAVTVGGFPFRLTAETDTVFVVRADGLTWQGGPVTATAPPWRWTDIRFVLDGGHTVTLPGNRPLTMVTESGTGTLRYRSTGQLRAASLDLNGVGAMLVPVSGQVAAEKLTLRADLLSPTGPTDPSLTASGSIQTIGLPDAAGLLLGPVIEQAAADIAISGPLPRDLRAGPVSRWRDADGAVRIDRLSLTWGPLVIDAEGAVRLSATLQPEGRLNARISGFVETIDTLVDARLIPPRQGGIAKAGLTLLAGPADENGVSVLTTPISIESGQVFLGPIALARLPYLEWPN